MDRIEDLCYEIREFIGYLLVYGYISSGCLLLIAMFIFRERKTLMAQIIAVSNVLLLTGSVGYLVAAAIEAYCILFDQVSYRQLAFQNGSPALSSAGMLIIIYGLPVAAWGLVPQLLWFPKIRRSVYSLWLIPFLLVPVCSWFAYLLYIGYRDYLPGNIWGRLQYFPFFKSLMIYSAIIGAICCLAYRKTWFAKKQDNP